MNLRALTLAGWLLASPALAWNDADEERFRTLLGELRCLVCQNQSIGDSAAHLAQDLRDQVRRMIEDGKTDAEIRDYMVTRYGDFVLYRPPLKPMTWALWFGPFVLLGVGALVIWRLRRQQPPPPPVDAQVLRRILEDDQ